MKKEFAIRTLKRIKEIQETYHKRKALRNCVHPETGKHILDCALNIAPKKVIGSLFDENYTEL